MGKEIIQFYSGEHILGNKNIVEAIATDGDVVFNESYIVVGVSLEARHVHATYDLSVIGDIVAENININGDLFVKGDIDADELICRGTFICTGEVRVKKLSMESYSVADSIVGEELYVNGDLFVRTTVDTDSSLEVDGLLVAGEGIMGDGSFKAMAAIANEYFEFTGKSKGKVFEISEMDFSVPEIASEPGVGDIDETIDILKATEVFNKTFSQSLEEWSQLEEDDFIEAIRSVIALMHDLHFVDRIIDKVVELSYEREVTNFRDFLYILCARNVFPESLAKYETFEPILNDMYDEAITKVLNMEFKAGCVDEFACSLYILDAYQSQLPISVEVAADKIFSSIGLRYSTVEHAWRDYNG